MLNSPGIETIRPMSLSDILDAAIRMYRHNFGPFLGIVAIAYVPVIIGQMLLVPVMMAAESKAGGETAELMALIPVFAVLGVMALTSMVSIPLSQAALIWAISERYLGHECGVRAAYRAVFAKFGRVIAVMVIAGLATFIGFMLCIIPGIVVGILFTFAVAEVMINGKDARSALERSWYLALRDFWKVFVTLMVLGIVVYIISTVLSVPLGILAVVPMMASEVAYALYTQSVMNGLQVLVSVIVMPVQIIGTILLYYDMRVRHEGFDLQLLAQSMGVHDNAGGYAPVQTTSLLSETVSSEDVKSEVPPVVADVPSPWDAQYRAPAGHSPNVELPPKIDDDEPE